MGKAQQLGGMFARKENIRSLPSTDEIKLHIPATKSDMTNRDFTVRGKHNWRNLAPEIQNASSITSTDGKLPLCSAPDIGAGGGKFSLSS